MLNSKVAAMQNIIIYSNSLKIKQTICIIYVVFTFRQIHFRCQLPLEVNWAPLKSRPALLSHNKLSAGGKRWAIGGANGSNVVENIFGADFWSVFRYGNGGF